MFRNSHNWKAASHALWLFSNPLGLAVAILRREAPVSVRVRTPTGPVTLYLRNFESLKTAFSVFCRGDYRMDGRRARHFVDVGANVGISAVYFLTRHPQNTVRCYEPDQANLEVLRENLAAFGARAVVEAKAVAPARGWLKLFRSEDGKYSSTLEHPAAVAVQSIEAQAFADVLAQTRHIADPIVVKLDVEGIERDLIASVDFGDYPNIERLFTESTNCGELIDRAHVRSLRNGYVEDLSFHPGIPC